MEGLWQLMDDEVQMWARIFLAIFVLIGLFPFFQKSFSRIHDFVLSLRRPRAPGIAASTAEPADSPAPDSGMSDIEYFVFRGLSQIGARGAPLRRLARTLHMDSLVIRRALESLHRKGLVRVVPGFVLGRRFALSGQGRARAVAEGLTPRLSRQPQ